jgi:hypothetical protein
VKGKDEIGRFSALGYWRNHRGTDKNRSGFVVRAEQDSRMGDRADRAIVSREFRAITMDMANLHKAGERHCDDTQQTQQPESV